MIPKICAFCGKPFDADRASRKYCCQGCATRGGNLVKGHQVRVQTPCVICGGPIPEDRPYRITCCRDCDHINRSRKASMPRPNWKPPKTRGEGHAIGRTGMLVNITRMPDQPWPLPVDPQYAPFDWQEAAHAA